MAAYPNNFPKLSQQLSKVVQIFRSCSRTQVDDAGTNLSTFGTGWELPHLFVKWLEGIWEIRSLHTVVPRTSHFGGNGSLIPRKKPTSGTTRDRPASGIMMPGSFSCDSVDLRAEWTGRGSLSHQFSKVGPTTFSSCPNFPKLLPHPSRRHWY